MDAWYGKWRGLSMNENRNLSEFQHNFLGRHVCGRTLSGAQLGPIRKRVIVQPHYEMPLQAVTA